MLRPNLSGLKGCIGRSKRAGKRAKNNSYEKMMKTLLLQNQQIIIQQQNMMFMVMKQFQTGTTNQPQQPGPDTLTSPSHPTVTQASLQNHHHHHQHLLNQHNQVNHVATTATTSTTTATCQQQPTEVSQQQQQQPQTSRLIHHHEEHSNHHHHNHHQQQQQTHSDQQHQQLFSHHQAGTSAGTLNSHQQHLQQVASHLQENLTTYLTPAASEQDPISDNKPEDEDLAALLDGDALLTNNLLYNPQTDVGAVTPYKDHQQQQQTPSYYSSGGESLTTPRIEQQRQPMTTNISQNVVKNLADSFKSPTKPKINVQILSGSATRNMKNSKAKIIQRMNISEFLRHVHQDEAQKSSTQ